MAEEKEQLRISAELDTSKLKQQAQQGMQSVVNEEKKVENQSNQTSKAIDAIGQSGKNVGNALQQAGSQGADALKQVGQEADKTSQKIDEIAKATKNINLGRAFGIASRFANSDYGKAIGNSIGDSLGMSDSEKSTAGSALQGGLQGAAMGAMIGGPWGAAIGGLVGAGATLLQAGKELQKAAKEEEGKWSITKQQSYDRQEAEQFNSTLRNGTRSELEEALRKEETRISKANADIADLREQDAKVYRTESEYDYVTYETYERQVEDLEATAKKAAELTERLTNAEKERADALARQQALVAELARREAELAAKREAEARKKEAEANLPVGPEIPEYIRAQREAEEEARKQAEQEARARQKAFDTYTIEQKRERISNLQDTQLKPLESMMSGMASFRLTDSLTRIGGGAGYGVQMQGINRYVSSISNNIQTIKGIIQQELDAIRELSNKYKPYYGEFMAQQDN